MYNNFFELSIFKKSNVHILPTSFYCSLEAKMTSYPLPQNAKKPTKIAFLEEARENQIMLILFKK